MKRKTITINSPIHMDIPKNAILSITKTLPRKWWQFWNPKQVIQFVEGKHVIHKGDQLRVMVK
jgi:hypothetical protein